MVTKRRPWPNHAKEARENALWWSKRIYKLGEDAKNAEARGNSYKLRMAITEMQALAGQISTALAEVEAPPDEEEQEDEEEAQVERPALRQVK